MVSQKAIKKDSQKDYRYNREVKWKLHNWRNDGWHLYCHPNRVKSVMGVVVKWWRIKKQGILTVQFWVTPLWGKKMRGCVFRKSYMDFSSENILWLFKKWYWGLPTSYWRYRQYKKTNVLMWNKDWREINKTISFTNNMIMYVYTNVILYIHVCIYVYIHIYTHINEQIIDKP